MRALLAKKNHLRVKVAYISHVDSRWIKQRPQFLAEALAGRGVDVTYVCSTFVRRRSLVSKQKLAIPVVRVPLLPQSLRAKLGAFESLAAYFSALAIRVRVGPAVIIVTHARHAGVARVLNGWGVRVYYDCMDLNNLFVDSIDSDVTGETELIRQCEKVFCSSGRIREHILALHPDARTVSVTNGLDAGSFATPAQATAVEHGTVGYMGAVSAWFDFDVLLALLAADSEIVINICGPVDIPIPAHDRIRVLGILPHSEAIAAMSRCSVLVLPFQVGELIEAVDPVKIYEYVATGRPVVAVSYAQLEHFGHFIARYTSEAEFVSQVRALLGSANLDEGARERFVEENAWSRRAAVVQRELQEC